MVEIINDYNEVTQCSFAWTCNEKSCRQSTGKHTLNCCQSTIMVGQNFNYLTLLMLINKI
jgi:hypothetical protein